VADGSQHRGGLERKKITKNERSEILAPTLRLVSTNKKKKKRLNTRDECCAEQQQFTTDEPEHAEGRRATKTKSKHNTKRVFLRTPVPILGTRVRARSLQTRTHTAATATQGDQ